MVTTVIAAIVGFQALKFGRLTFMAGMGTMVSIGLVSCMVAAMTVVPVALVLGKGTMWERIKEKIKTGKSKRRNEI
jgi:predicted RND superfamily exporter protein